MNKPLLLKIFSILTAVESAAVILILASIPADVKNALLLGLSASRLALLGAASVILLLSLALLAFSARAEKLADSIFASGWISWAGGIVSALGILFLLMPVQVVDEALRQRVSPLVWLVILIALQILILQFIWLGKQINIELWRGSKQSFVIAGIVAVVIAVVAVIAALTGIGITPEFGGWFPPGTPLLSQQVLFAWVVGLIFIFWGTRLEKNKKFDWVIGAFLWLSAVLIWWLEPLKRLSYFTPAPTAPNFEYYPYSDAALYDEFAQSIMIGTSRAVGVTHRPLYSFLIALFHAIGGQKFDTVILLQILLVAVMPVFVYLLVNKMGGRAAGIIAALAVIFRERNSIALTNINEVSHVKLLMSDVPTMMMMVLFMYFLVKWLEDREGRYLLGALAGGFFGLAVMIRSQSQLLIPIVLFGILVYRKFEWKVFLQKSAVFLAGFLLVIVPWVVRNYQISGRPVVEYQEFYTRIAASAYASTLEETEMLPGETLKDYDARMKSLIINTILENPLDVARWYSSYFLHNEISAVIYLPMSPRFENTILYSKEMDVFNYSFGAPPMKAIPMFVFSLTMIALGIGSAVQRMKWVGVMPLLLHFGYSFSVAPLRMSGWRFILPVDWVTLLYYSIGLVQLTTLVIALFSQKKDQAVNEAQILQSASWKGTGIALAVFAVIGLTFPLVEFIIPDRYPTMTNAELIQKYVPNGFTFDDGEQVNAAALDKFLATESGAVVMQGRALFPSYYSKGKFWGEDNSIVLEMSQYDRLQFNLMDKGRQYVFIPLESAPEYFPHASDVLVIGCMKKESVRALFVSVNGHALPASPWPGLTCSE